MYRVKDWDRLFESNRTRDLKRMDWVMVPNHHDGDRFRTLIERPRGTALFGAWVLILQVASKCSPRGLLVRAAGVAHTGQSIARMTGADEKIITEALDILSCPDVGWLEPIESDIPYADIPPARLPSAGDKGRANGRIARLLDSGEGVITPSGPVRQRPRTCQWCEKDPGVDAKSVTNIRAHHFLPYGPKENDRVVIFVCRSCHGFFETGKITDQAIFDRFGTSFIPQSTAIKPQSTAGDRPCSAVPTRASRAVTEGNGREWKGMEQEIAPPKTEEVIVLPKWTLDEHYQEFAETAREFWKDLIDEDLSGWYYEWTNLDFDQKQFVIGNVRQRIEAGQSYVKAFKPTFFTKREWKRPVLIPPPPAFGPDRQEVGRNRTNSAIKFLGGGK